MDPEKLAELAAAVFGPDRVRTRGGWTTRSRWRWGWPTRRRRRSGLARTGVLVTGSVITAGDARGCCWLAGSGGGGGRAGPMRRLCATVLIMEAIVIGLAIPVAITIEHDRTRRPAGRRVLAVVAVLLAGW